MNKATAGSLALFWLAASLFGCASFPDAASQEPPTGVDPAATAGDTLPQASLPAKEAAAMPTTAPHLSQDNTDQMRALKQGIDDVDASDFADVRLLDRHLSTELSSARQQEEPSNPRLLIRSSAGGSFAGLRVSRVELVTYKDRDPSDARLSIDLAEPGPDADTFVRMYWPDAEFTPSSPHGLGSPSFWTFKQGSHTISIDFKLDDTRITGIGFSHEQ